MVFEGLYEHFSDLLCVCEIAAWICSIFRATRSGPGQRRMVAIDSARQRFLDCWLSGYRGIQSRSSERRKHVWSECHADCPDDLIDTMFISLACLIRFAMPRSLAPRQRLTSEMCRSNGSLSSIGVEGCNVRVAGSGSLFASVPMLPTADQSLKPRHYSDNDMGHA